MTTTVASLAVVITGDSKGAESALSRTDKKIRSFGKTAETGGRSFLGFRRNIDDSSDSVNRLDRTSRGAAVGVGVLGAAMTKWMVSGFSSAINFEAAMINVRAITNASTADMSMMTDTVNALSVQYGKSAVDLAGGLAEIAGAGFSASDSVIILTEATKGAVAGATDARVVADGLTSALNAYGANASDAAHYTNVMTQAVNLGKITAEEYSAEIGTTAPLAAALGVSIEELGAAYAAMTQKGIEANEASTQLNAIMSAMLKPTDALSGAIKNYGYESGAALVQAEGLPGVFKMLQSATAGMSDDQLNEFFGGAITNIRALRGVMALTGPEFEAMIAQFMNVDGGMGTLSSTEQMLATQSESTAFALSRLRATFDLMMRSLVGGLLPVIRAVANIFGVLATAIAILPKPVQLALGVALGLGAAFATAAGGAALFGTSIGAIVTGIGALILPIALVAGAIGLLYAAFRSNFGGLRTFIDKTAGKVTSFFHNLRSNYQTFKQFESLGPIGGAIFAFGGAIEQVFGVEIASKAYRFGQGIAATLRGIRAAFSTGLKVDDLVQTVPKSFQGVARAAFTLADDLGDIGRQIQQGDWGGLWSELKDTGSHVVDYSVDVAVKFGKLIWGGVSSIWDWVKGQIGASSTPWSPGMSPSQVGSNDGIIRIGDLSLQTNLGDLSWDDSVDWAQYVSGLIETADTNITAALGVGRTETQLDQANQAGYDQGYAWGQTLAQKIRDGFSSGSQSDALTGDEDTGLWSMDTLKKILKWEPPFARDQQPTFIDEWIQQANGWGRGLRVSIVKAIRDGFFGAEETSGVGAGSHVERDGGIWDSLMGAFDIPDFLENPPDLPKWLTDAFWITNPVANLVKAIKDAIQDLKDAWGLLAFWKHAGGKTAKDMVPDYRIPQVGDLDVVTTDTGTGDRTHVPAVDPSTANPFANFDPSGADKFKTAVANAGLAAQTAAPLLDTNKIALDSLAQAFTAAHQPVQGFVDQGTIAMQQFAQAVSAESANAMNGLNGTLATGVNTATGLAGSGGLSIGNALGQGIYVGMQSWAGQIATTAAMMVTNAVNAARVAADAHSPSRAMMRLGDDLVDGLMIPLAGRSGEVRTLMAGMVNTDAIGPRPARDQYSVRKGGDTIIVNALKSDELVNLIAQAEKGGKFATSMSNKARNYMLATGGAA